MLHTQSKSCFSKAVSNVHVLPNCTNPLCFIFLSASAVFSSLGTLGPVTFAGSSQACANSSQFFSLPSPSRGAWCSLLKFWLLEWQNVDSCSCSSWENQSSWGENVFYSLATALVAPFLPHPRLLILVPASLCFLWWHFLNSTLFLTAHMPASAINPSPLNLASTHLTFTFQFIELSPIPSSL